MNKTHKVMALTGIALALIWLFMIIPSREGYGYHGYGGYQPGGWSFFYWGGSNVSYPQQHSPSARDGSVGGPRASSRGLRGGK